MIRPPIGIIQNASQTGILIKINQPLRYNYVELYFVNLGRNQQTLNGKVIHCKENPSGQFEIAIRLLGSREQNLEFVKAWAQQLQRKTIPTMTISGFMAQ